MNELQKLIHTLRQELPTATVKLDETVGGPHFAWLDIEYEGRSIAVEWRRTQGFGVSVLPENPANPCEGLFEGPDEVLADWESARDYILLRLAESSAQGNLRRAALA